jgi:hypothetical protein
MTFEVLPAAPAFVEAFVEMYSTPFWVVAMLFVSAMLVATCVREVLLGRIAVRRGVLLAIALSLAPAALPPVWTAVLFTIHGRW